MCTCDHKKKADAMASVVRVDGMFFFDAQDKMVCLYDAKGFRSQLPGECNTCYLNWKLKYIQNGNWQ